MSSVRYHPLALNEYKEAALYYGLISAGLADRFTEQIESNVKEITDFPESFPLIHRRVRNCVLLKFPYSILYANTEAGLFIVAVMHHKRHPDYWKDRLKDIPE